MEKVTKKVAFGEIETILRGADRVDLAEVMAHEIELLNKKSSNRKSKNDSEENVAIREEIKKVLANGSTLQIKDLMANSPTLKELSNQKVAYQANYMVGAGELVKVADKKTSLFKLA